MTYIITQKPAFLSDFVLLTRHQQNEVVKAVQELTERAEDFRLKSVKKLAGYRNVWRYRIGDHRIVYSVAGRVVQLLAVGPRGTIYERFGVDGEVFDPTLVERVEDAIEPARKESAQPYPYGYSHHQEARALPIGLTESVLNQWLIPAEYHTTLMSCRTEDDLLSTTVPAVHIERVLDCLWPQRADAVVRQPSLVLWDPEDLRKYADGDLLGFLLKLDEDQERLIDWALRGPTLVKGGPGSGKSTVALYRAARLLNSNTSNPPRVLFTTYTTPLATVSQQLIERLCGDKLPPTLEVTHIDRLVYKIAARIGGAPTVASQDELLALLQSVRRQWSSNAESAMLRAFVGAALGNLSDQYLLEEFEWVIEGQACATEKHYQDADRTGRGHPLNEVLRHAIWDLFQAFREAVDATGKTTFSRLRLIALDAIRTGKWSRKYDYVLIDEAQDLSPTALAICVELCSTPDGIFLTADSNQSLYNRGFRWKRVHERLQVTGRTRLLTRNYRTTQEIAVAAYDLVVDISAADLEALTQGYVHRGGRPVVAAFDSDEEQITWIAERIADMARRLRLPLGAAAILVAHNATGDYVGRLAEQVGLPARYMSSKDVDVRCPEVKIITIHSAKGLEFPIVAIPFLSDDVMPGLDPNLDQTLQQEHLDSARRLMFVACTRAMRALILTCPKHNPSRFLDGLIEEHWEWVG